MFLIAFDFLGKIYEILKGKNVRKRKRFTQSLIIESYASPSIISFTKVEKQKKKTIGSDKKEIFVSYPKCYFEEKLSILAKKRKQLLDLKSQLISLNSHIYKHESLLSKSTTAQLIYQTLVSGRLSPNQFQVKLELYKQYCSEFKLNGRDVVRKHEIKKFVIMKGKQAVIMTYPVIKYEFDVKKVFFDNGTQKQINGKNWASEKSMTKFLKGKKLEKMLTIQE
ncbi:hypothetical protein G9A89_000987 [Geosiphon pyriformis]|nr:hypothetical protein G9A89_000987 [Geosiphon pyriformis]